MRKLTELRSQMDRCSKCGNCQAVCPLYLETKREPLVARGKIYLLDALMEGRLDWSKRMEEVISLCLLCRTCEVNCPNGVQVSRLVLAAREELARARGLSIWKKTAFHYLLTSSGNLNLLGRLLYLYHRSGLQAVARKSGLLNTLPWGLGDKERLLPRAGRRAFAKTVPPVMEAAGEKRRIGYFYGCMTNHAYPGTGQAFLTVMRANGVSVVLPPQVCCGLPALASGDREAAVKLARRNIRWFNEAGVDRVVVDCASCGSMLKEYGEIAGTPEAAEFSRKVRDVAEFFTEDVDFRPGANPMEITVTYHDPCHAKRYQGIHRAPRQLLQALPGVTVKEMEGADRCCGSAGSFNLTHCRLSMRVGSHKTRSILATGAEAVATGCPACRLQLEKGLEQAGSSVPVVHTLEILSRSYH